MKSVPPTVPSNFKLTSSQAYKQVGHEKEEALKAEQQAKAEIASLKTELESIQVELETSKQEVGKQTVSIQTLNSERQNDKATAERAQDKLKAALETSTKQLEQLRTSVKTLEGRVLPTTPGSRVWISMVMWGNRFLHGEDLYRKCRDYCMSRKPVPFTNQFFGCDPMPGVRKTGVIAYQYDGKGLVRYLGLPEGESGPFDNWP